MVNPHSIARIRITQMIHSLDNDPVRSESDLRMVKTVLEDANYAIHTSVSDLYRYEDENIKLKARIDELEKQLDSERQSKDMLRVALHESLHEKKEIALRLHNWLDLSSLYHSESMYHKGDLISAFALISKVHQRLMHNHGTAYNGFAAYLHWLNEGVKEIIREEKTDG